MWLTWKRAAAMEDDEGCGRVSDRDLIRDVSLTEGISPVRVSQAWLVGQTGLEKIRKWIMGSGSHTFHCQRREVQAGKGQKPE